MRQKGSRNVLKKVRWTLLGQGALLVLALVLIVLICLNNNQASAALPMGISFQGEYRIADGTWQPIRPNKHIPSTEGDVTLRGSFWIVTPEGELLCPLQKGEMIALYFDHIGAEVLINGECVHVFDAENPNIGTNTCGEQWLGYEYAGEEAGSLEIVLKNPHRLGNPKAVDEFLSSMCPLSAISFENRTRMSGNAERIIGFVVFVLAILILGMAFFSSILHIAERSLLWQIGLALLFASGYLIFSSPNISLWSRTIVWNTTTLLLCMMLYVFFLMILTVRCLPEKMKKSGRITVIAAGCATGLVLVAALTQSIVLYDAVVYWAAAQSICAAVLLCCCVLSFRRSNGLYRLLLLCCVLSLAALLIDITATAFGWWQGAFFCKGVFVLLFAAALFLVLRVTPVNLHAARRKKKLEAELQESRVAIMRSQIQPHFLYNALDSIYHLCGKDPQRAQQALGEFSDYLRMNLASLDRKTPVSFEAELRHIQTYLMLEKMSSDDELECVYDIQTVAFALPALSVQPLVENAVKHGIGKKAGGGTVTLCTREYDDRFEVTVCDDGVGFDPEEVPKDGKLHIGIENIRQRLSVMCGGTLQIRSRIGEGTTAVVTIPKGGRKP